MSLNQNAFEKITKQFDSYKSLFDIILDIINLNDITKFKLFKLLFFIFLSFGFGTYLSVKTTFKTTFQYITDINLTISVGLLGLLIAGFSIVMSSLNKDALYCLILYEDDKKNKSYFKKTLLLCMEPLIWFTLLLMLTYSLKLMYLIYPTHGFIIEYILILKSSIVGILIFIGIISINSLINFLLNIYNLLALYGKFEVLERFAKANDNSIESVIKNFEDSLNNKYKNNDK